MKKLYLIDISSFIFRAYYAVRPLTTKEGIPVNAVFGVVSMLNKLIDKHKPDHMIVCCDQPGKGFRHEIYPEYKANRSEPPEDLIPQFDLIHDFIHRYPISSIGKEGYEADDVIATLVKKYKNEPELEIYIVSSDKDLMQLVNKNVFLYDTMKEKVYKHNDVIEKLGVPPQKVIDLQSLCGDASDNIPGIQGVGPKTAVKLINEFGDLENVLNNGDQLKGKLSEKVVSGKDQALLSRKLVTLVDDVEFETSWEELQLRQRDHKALNEFYKKLEFNSFVTKETNQVIKKTEKKADFILIRSINQLKNIVSHIFKEKPQYIAIDTETKDLKSLTSELVGVSLCLDSETAYYIPIAHECDNNLLWNEVCEVLNPVFQDPEIGKVGQNLKFDLNVLSQHSLKIIPITHDTLIASYLADPEGQHNLDYLAQKYLGVETIKFSDVVPKKLTFANTDLKIATDYAAEDAWVAFQLVEPLMQEIEKAALTKIYKEIELPLVSVLTQMEQTGVLIDVKFLDALQEEFAEQLKTLEKNIYDLAGEEFNVNSPKQLSVILFEKLHLPIIKKTKTGFSTDVDVLTELSREHELPNKLLRYRLLNKLLSTYVVQLKNLINSKTNRVHTNFNQAIVATGRLSSTEPNLQNIPIKTEEGRRIRQAFKAPDGSVLLSADYSQIELRLLAAFSKDQNLVDAYLKNQDIHARTAAHILGLQIDDVDQNQRGIGKTINFGVIYGQSPFGLAKQLGVPQKEAKRFIDSFFQEFSGVKDYKEHVLQQARETGYVTTYLGRRRYIKDINSKNFMTRQNAERMAFNAVFQGSAADLIKKAMVQINAQLKKDDLKSKLIIQVHDELLFEVLETEMDQMKHIVVSIMEGAFDLEVPLKVCVGFGKTWAEAH